MTWSRRPSQDAEKADIWARGEEGELAAGRRTATGDPSLRLPFSPKRVLGKEITRAAARWRGGLVGDGRLRWRVDGGGEWKEGGKRSRMRPSEIGHGEQANQCSVLVQHSSRRPVTCLIPHHPQHARYLGRPTTLPPHSPGGAGLARRRLKFEQRGLLVGGVQVQCLIVEVDRINVLSSASSPSDGQTVKKR